MRLYYFMMVASTSLPTRVAGTSGVSITSMTEVNSTVSSLSSFNDSINIPVIRMMKVRNSTDNEERMTRLDAPLGRYLLCGGQEKSLFTLYGGIKTHRLTPASWRRVIVRDENVLRGVYALRRLNTNQNMYSLLDQVQSYIKAYRATKLLSEKSKLGLWMAGQRPEDLIEVLKKRKFSHYLSFERVGALEKFIEDLNEILDQKMNNKFNKAKRLKYSLIETLLELFDEAKFTSMLSAAKLSPITGDDAKLLQNKLLTSWQGAKKSVDEVWDLLKVKTTGLTYENLDTLIEYTALVSEKPAEARSRTLSYVKKKLCERELVKAIAKGEKAGFQSAESYLRDRYREANTEVARTNHKELNEQHETELFLKWKVEQMSPNELIKYLKTELFHKWMAKNMSPRRLHKSHFRLRENTQIQRDYEAFLEESLELSLRPPGT